MSKTDWVEVGQCPVDAGCIVLVDPCYMLEGDREAWYQSQVVDKANEKVSRLATPDGTADAGVLVSTGYGDGCYPVEVRYADDGRVAEVRVVFIEEEA